MFGKHFITWYNYGPTFAWAVSSPLTRVGKIISAINISITCAGIVFIGLHRLGKTVIFDTAEMQSRAGLIIFCAGLVANLITPLFSSNFVRAKPDIEPINKPWFHQTRRYLISPVEIPGVMVFVFMGLFLLAGVVNLAFPRTYVDAFGGVFLIALAAAIYTYAYKRKTRYFPDDEN